MSYVDGFVLPVPRKNLAAYRRMAQEAGKVWMKHGALQYVEAAGDDLATKGFVPFPSSVKAKPSETVVFAWIVFKSKSHRNQVNKKVMSDPQLEKMMAGKKMPFDHRRMLYGGFKVIVER